MDGDITGESLRVTVVVTRTGGIAGLRREWRVESHGPEASSWITLIEECPWPPAVSEQTGADRFVWSIAARLGARRRAAELSDEQIDGPWASLVEAVRTRGAPVPPPSPAPPAPPASPAPLGSTSPPPPAV